MRKLIVTNIMSVEATSGPDGTYHDALLVDLLAEELT